MRNSFAENSKTQNKKSKHFEKEEKVSIHKTSNSSLPLVSLETLKFNDLNYNNSLMPQIQLPPKFIFPSTISRLYSDYYNNPPFQRQLNANEPQIEQKEIGKKAETTEQEETPAKSFRIKSSREKKTQSQSLVKNEIRFLSKEIEEGTRRVSLNPTNEQKLKNLSRENSENTIRKLSLRAPNSERKSLKNLKDNLIEITKKLKNKPALTEQSKTELENDESESIIQIEGEKPFEKEREIMKKLSLMNDLKESELDLDSSYLLLKKFSHEEGSQKHLIESKFSLETKLLAAKEQVSPSQKNSETRKINNATDSVNEIVAHSKEQQVIEQKTISPKIAKEFLEINSNEDKSLVSESESNPLSTNTLENNQKIQEVVEITREETISQKRRLTRGKKLSISKGATLNLSEKQVQFSFYKPKSFYSIGEKKNVKLKNMDKKKIAKTSKNLMNFVNSLDKFIRANVGRKSVVNKIEEKHSESGFDIQKILQKEKPEEGKFFESDKVQIIKTQDYTINIISPEGQSILRDTQKVPESKFHRKKMNKFLNEENFKDKSIFQNASKNSQFVKEYLTYFLEDVVVQEHFIKEKFEKKRFPNIHVSYDLEGVSSKIKNKTFATRNARKKTMEYASLNIKNESSDTLNMEEFSDESVEQSKSDFEEDENVILLKNGKVAEIFVPNEFGKIDSVFDEELKPILNFVNDEKKLLISKNRNKRKTEGKENLLNDVFGEANHKFIQDDEEIVRDLIFLEFDNCFKGQFVDNIDIEMNLKVHSFIQHNRPTKKRTTRRRQREKSLKPMKKKKKSEIQIEETKEDRRNSGAQEKTSSSNFSNKMYDEQKSSNQLTMQWEKTPIPQGSSHFLNANTFSSLDRSPGTKEKRNVVEKQPEYQAKPLLRGRSDSNKNSMNERESFQTSQSPRKIVGNQDEEVKIDSKEKLMMNSQKTFEKSIESMIDETTYRRRINRPTITVSTTGITPKILLNSKKTKDDVNISTPRKKTRVVSSPTKFRSILSGNNMNFEQALQKMDRSSLLMRTHMVSYKKRQRMNPVDQMISAVQEDKINELEELFMIYPNSLIDSRDFENNTLLMIASKTGSLDIVHLLLNKGANPNSCNNQGDTALHYALAFSNFEIADLLINNGADQLFKNSFGKTPWDMT